jgi:hypothetical protein
MNPRQAFPYLTLLYPVLLKVPQVTAYALHSLVPALTSTTPFTPVSAERQGESLTLYTFHLSPQRWPCN